MGPIGTTGLYAGASGTSSDTVMIVTETVRRIVLEVWSTPLATTLVAKSTTTQSQTGIVDTNLDMPALSFLPQRYFLLQSVNADEGQDNERARKGDSIGT